MPRFGDFETVRKIAPGAVGAVYSARPAGSSDEPTFAVRLFEPDPLVVGDDLAEAQVDDFLARAEALARVGSAVASAEGAAGGFGGPAIWAPVYDVGKLPNSPGAYYVTDLALPHEPSLEALSRTRVVFDPVSLGAIVGKVVHALKLGRQHAGRAHAALTPSRVLLLSPGDLAQARVALVDPLSDDDERLEEGELSDQRAIGDLVYTLVQHQRPKNVFRVSDTRPWVSALGKEADRWIELVHVLLDPSESASRPTIEQLDAQMAQMREGRGGGGGTQRRADTRTMTGSRTDLKPPTLSSVPKSVMWGATRTRELPAIRPGGVPGMQAAKGPVSAARAAAGRAPISAVGLSGAFPAVNTPTTVPQSALPAIGPVSAANIPGGAPTSPSAPQGNAGKSGAGAVGSSGVAGTGAAAAPAPLKHWGTPVTTVPKRSSRGVLIAAGAAMLVAAGGGAWWVMNRGSETVLPPGTGEVIANVPTAPSAPTTPSEPSAETTGGSTVSGDVASGVISRQDAQRRADTEIPALTLERANPPAWATAFVAAVNQERTKATDDAIRRSSRGSGDEVNQAALENRLSEAKTRINDRVSAARATLADLLEVSDALADAHAVGVDDAAPGTRQWRARQAQISGEPSWAAALSPLTLQIEALQSVARQTDGAQIASSIAPESAPPALAALAWKRVAEINWPARAGDLSVFGRLRDAVTSAAQRAASAERKQALQQSVLDGTRAAWVRVATGAADIASFSSAMQARAALGVGDDAVTPAMRVNARIAALHEALGKSQTQDDLKVQLSTFDRDVAALGVSPELRQQADGAVAGLRAASTKPPPVKAAPEGPSSPGVAVSASGGVSGDRGTFRVGGITLDFERVSADGKDAYIGAREMALGEVMAIITAAGKWNEFRELAGLGSEDESGLDWTGPRVWTWNGRELNRNRDWLMIAGFADESPYPQGVTKPRAPTTSAPIQGISAQAAAYVAQLVGCRFPTVGEWQAAQRLSPTTAPVLWDASCDALAAYHAAQNWGPQFGQTFKKTPAGSAGRASGTFVWFRTAQESGDRIRDLTGNVAEFVLNRAGVVQASGAEGLRSFLAQAAGERSLGVIGGSRLWPASEPTDRPAWIADQADGLKTPADAFSDVGFRLAFNAPSTAPESIKDEIEAQRRALRLVAGK